MSVTHPELITPSLKAAMAELEGMGFAAYPAEMMPGEVTILAGIGLKETEHGYESQGGPEVSISQLGREDSLPGMWMGEIDNYEEDMLKEAPPEVMARGDWDEIMSYGDPEFLHVYGNTPFVAAILLKLLYKEWIEKGIVTPVSS